MHVRMYACTHVHMDTWRRTPPATTSVAPQAIDVEKVTYGDILKHFTVRHCTHSCTGSTCCEYIQWNPGLQPPR